MLELENVETLYDRIYALRGVSLNVAEGSITQERPTPPEDSPFTSIT